MRLGRSLVAVAGGAVLGGVMAAPAGADPQKGEVLDLSCDVLGDIQVVVFSNGRGSPGLLVGGNQVGIPYALDLTVTFTPTGGDPMTEVEQFEKPAPRNGRLDHCTFHQEESDPSGTFVLDGEVWISYTPH